MTKIEKAANIIVNYALLKQAAMAKQASEKQAFDPSAILAHIKANPQLLAGLLGGAGGAAVGGGGAALLNKVTGKKKVNPLLAALGGAGVGAGAGVGYANKDAIVTKLMQLLGKGAPDTGQAGNLGGVPVPSAELDDSYDPTSKGAGLGLSALLR